MTRHLIGFFGLELPQGVWGASPIDLEPMATKRRLPMDRRALRCETKRRAI